MITNELHREFVLAFKARWNAPWDWNEKSVAAGTSSVIVWLRWIDSTPGWSLDDFNVAISRIPAGGDPPTLARVQWQYKFVRLAEVQPAAEPQRRITPAEISAIIDRAGIREWAKE